MPFAGWELLRDEALEHGAQVLLMIRDVEGRAVRRIEGPAAAGIHRVNWDLRLPAPNAIDLSTPGFTPPWVTPPQGPLAPPGHYRVEMALVSADGVTPMGEPQEFDVKLVPGTVLPAPDYDDVTAFQRRTSELLRKAQGAAAEVRRAEERLRHMRAALKETPRAEPTLYARLDAIESRLADARLLLMGDRIRGRLNESSVPSILGRIGRVAGGHWDTRQAPTATQTQSLDVAQETFDPLSAELTELLTVDLPGLKAEFEAAGAPWTSGRRLP